MLQRMLIDDFTDAVRVAGHEREGVIGNHETALRSTFVSSTGSHKHAQKGTSQLQPPSTNPRGACAARASREVRDHPSCMSKNEDSRSGHCESRS